MTGLWRRRSPKKKSVRTARLKTGQREKKDSPSDQDDRYPLILECPDQNFFLQPGPEIPETMPDMRYPDPGSPSEDFCQESFFVFRRGNNSQNGVIIHHFPVFPRRRNEDVNGSNWRGDRFQNWL